MDIKITDKALRRFLDTSATPKEIADTVSLCGPTFDRLSKAGKDFLYEIEVITNRIDTAGAQGIAREVSAILNQKGIKSSMINDPYREKIGHFDSLPKTFNFEITNPRLSPRFTAVSLENIDISDSPDTTKELLTACGERPINNAVDITNELTILYGLPSHVFDLDKLGAQKLTVRESIKGEKVSTLDGQANALRGGDIVIEDGTGGIVDLCGIMGGSLAEVDQHTKNILLIVPVYDPAKVRKTSLYLQKRTLAAQIYEKLPDTQLCLPVITEAIKLFKERAGARVSSPIFDSDPNPHKIKEIALDTNWANRFIGIDIPSAELISILESLGFGVSKKDAKELICTVPSWRDQDINIKEDLVEEIARVYGYSKLPPVLPCVNLPPEEKNRLLELEAKIKKYLSCTGFNEIYNSSLISEDLIKNTGLSPADHLKLTNALSADYEYLRISLVPSILKDLTDNQGKTEEPFFLYEISNIYQKTGEKLPQENSNLVIASTAEYREVKGDLESLLRYLKIPRIKFSETKEVPAYFLNSYTAMITSNDKLIGYIGSIKPAILRAMDIRSNPVIIEIDLDVTSKIPNEPLVYIPVSEYPEVVEQITIESNGKIGDIIEKISTSNKAVNQVSFIESFKNKHTFKVTFSSMKKNLTQQEVNEIKKAILELFN